ncbi:MAG: efflux RND transporter permease subunit, partial [Fidelibacterota bacterium]
MRQQLFDKLANFVTRKTGVSLIIILIVTLITGYFSSKLEINMNLADLLPKSSPMLKEFNYVTENFPGAVPMIIVLQGDEEKLKEFAIHLKPEIEHLSPWIERFASQKVRAQHRAVTEGNDNQSFSGRYYDRVDIKLPAGFFRDHGLMLMKERTLKRNRQLYEDPNFLPFLTHLNDNLEKEYIHSEEKISTMQKEREAVRFLDNIESWSDFTSRAFFEPEYNERLSREAAEAISIGNPFLFSPDRSIMLIMVEPTFNILDIEKLLPAVNGLEEMVKQEAKRAGVEAGLAGGMTLSRDEIVASTEDSMLLTVLALAGVFILFIITFRMFAAPFLAVLNLILGILWAMGVSYLLVGTLNMFTAMVSVILVGLGIDFSIHIISVYTEMRKKGETIDDAMQITFAKAGAGILTGGLTTAIAFLTLTTGRSAGIVEFGLVNGVGLVIVMLATLLILPTFLVIREKSRDFIREKIFKKSHKDIKTHDISYQYLGITGEKVYQKYRFALAAVVIVTVLLGYSITKVEFDYNYLNMEPEGLESVELNDLMINKFNMSSDPTMMTAESLQENYAFTQKTKEQSSISYVQSITDYLPPEEKQEARKPLVAAIHRKMKQSEITQNFPSDYKALIIEELRRLEANIIELQDLAFVGGQDMVDQKSTRLVGSANFVRAVMDFDEMTSDGKEITGEKVDNVKEMLNKVLSENYPEQIKKIIDNIITAIDKTALTNIDRMAALSNRLNELAAHPYMIGKITALVNDLMETQLQEKRMDYFCRDFAAAYKQITLDMADTTTIMLDMLPASTKDKFYSAEEDCYLITVYPKGNVWNIKYLESFSKDVLEITPRIAGLPPMFYYLIDIIGQDGKRAAILTLVVVFVMLLIDFRSLKITILAMLPLISGFTWMLGIMGLLGIKITLVNVMALPLILGIGIDDGIHILHRYKTEGKGAIKQVLSSTGKAIVITSFTTMVSFGSLVFATYRGFGSLGIALFIGVGACLLTSIFVLTPMIR